jgi:hypothetical protein
VDFIFMLTRDDRTVDNCLQVLDAVSDLGLRHIGFKDVGIDTRTLDALHERIKKAGATSYLEVVSLGPEAARRAALQAKKLGVDRLLGGSDMEVVLEVITGTGIEYYPFVGRPSGHPTLLNGSPEEIADGCRRATALGCAGVDLLAWRATDASPLELIQAARAAMEGRLIVAGSIRSPSQVIDLDRLGADAFTVGSALFEQRFAPDKDSLREQLSYVISLL